MKQKIWNVPNALTICRVVLVPLFMAAVIVAPDTPVWRVVAAALFILISLTDMLDGRIARARGLVTDFGKFLDPLADKLLIIGALVALLYRYREPLGDVLVWVTFLVVLRELAVTSLRLIAAGSSGKVIAANLWGKMKTFSQMVTVCVILLEPVVLTPVLHTPENLFSYAMLAVMCVATVGSGITYFVGYLKK